DLVLAHSHFPMTETRGGAPRPPSGPTPPRSAAGRPVGDVGQRDALEGSAISTHPRRVTADAVRPPRQLPAPRTSAARPRQLLPPAPPPARPRTAPALAPGRPRPPGA